MHYSKSISLAFIFCSAINLVAMNEDGQEPLFKETSQIAGWFQKNGNVQSNAVDRALVLLGKNTKNLTKKVNEHSQTLDALENRIAAVEERGVTRGRQKTKAELKFHYINDNLFDALLYGTLSTACGAFSYKVSRLVFHTGDITAAGLCLTTTLGTLVFLNKTTEKLLSIIHIVKTPVDEIN